METRPTPAEVERVAKVMYVAAVKWRRDRGLHRLKRWGMLDSLERESWLVPARAAIRAMKDVSGKG